MNIQSCQMFVNDVILSFDCQCNGKGIPQMVINRNRILFLITQIISLYPLSSEWNNTFSQLTLSLKLPISGDKETSHFLTILNKLAKYISNFQLYTDIMPFISSRGLEKLKEYKYVSGGYSQLDNKFNPFWVFISENYPMVIVICNIKWLAPNVITVISFSTMIIACAIQMHYDMTLTEDIPSWTFYFMAFAIFVYQTLDATDGKHARRTKSSSPLGQLFDHGLDSLILQLLIIGAAQATKMDRETLFYLEFFCQIALWAINQKEYYSGVLHTHISFFGGTELQLVAISVQLVSGIFGQEIWQKEVLGLKIYKFLASTILASLIITDILLFFSNVFTAKNPVRVFSEWISLILFWSLRRQQYIQKEFIWISQPIFFQLAGPLLVNFGIIFACKVCKTIVCTTTKDQTPLFHIELCPFLVISLMTFFLNFSHYYLQLLFWAQLLFTIVMTVSFIKGVTYGCLNKIYFKLLMQQQYSQ